MSELLAVALLLGSVWLVAIGLLELPLWVGAAGVAVFFIIALWLGFLEEEGEVLPVENSRGLRNEWRLVG